MATNAQRRAARRYQSRVRSILIRVNPRTERDVYDRLAEVENVSGYLKGLVREDVRRGGGVA